MRIIVKKFLIPALIIVAGYSISYGSDNTNGSITFVNQCKYNMNLIAIYSRMAIGRCHAYSHWLGTLHSNTIYKFSGLNTNCNFNYTDAYGAYEVPIYNNSWTSATVTYTNLHGVSSECVAQVTGQ